MFFGDALFARAFGFLSTHPPIDKRILKIEPRWNGQYLTGKPIAMENKPKATNNEGLSSLNDALNNAGALDPVMIAIAGALLESL